MKRSQKFLLNQTVKVLTAQRTQGSQAASHTTTTTSYEDVKPFNKIPGPPSVPLFGSLPYILMNSGTIPLKFLRNVQKDYGNVAKLKIPSLGEVIYIFDVEDHKKLLSLDGPEPYLPLMEIFANLRRFKLREYFQGTTGLMSQGKEWYDFRHAVQQDMMRPSSALFYIEDTENIAKVLVKKISEKKDEKGNPDVSRICQEYSLEAINVIFLGRKMGVLEGSDDGAAMINNTDNVFLEMNKMYSLPSTILGYELGWYKRLVESNRSLMEILYKNMNNSIKELDLEKCDSILAKLVRKCGKDSVIPQIMAADALFAGIDTTSWTINLLLYHVACNPEAQDKLYKEIVENIGEDGHITEESLKRLHYLRACLKESQRIFPIISGTMRKTQVDMVLGGYQIPADTNVGRFGYFNSMDEKNFPEPERFLPERWVRGCPSRHTADPFNVLPFGHGSRACVGQRFALLEMEVVIAKIIQAFHLSYSGNDIYMVQKSVIMTPSEPIIINYSERN